MYFVSVPSRGILFPNLYKCCDLTEYEIYGFRPLSGHLISKFVKKVILGDMEIVSVPSRGILFPNIDETWEYLSSLKSSFRPLSGHLISKWKREKGGNKMKKLVSVPSRGILFPNTNTTYNWNGGNKVSVPSRGILFPNKKWQTMKRLWNYCFRPLSGHLISKCSW